MLRAGDILSEMRLELRGFLRSLGIAKESVRRLGTSVSQVSQGITQQMGRDVTQFAKKSETAGKQMEGGWWKRFGVVALGFTVAYRAMNAFEAGLRKVGETLVAAIVESGELASFQAKQALWYRIYAGDVISYAEAFNRAAVNAKALGDASIDSMASLSELTVGFDELGQAGIIAGKKSTKVFADLVSFTMLVAQTVGSTTRQVRQEFQALTEGQVRTTNILIRTLLRTGIITQRDVENLKRMVDTEKIILKLATKISEEWTEVERRIIAADPVIALQYWEKHIRAIWRESITLASELEGVSNIFAEVFVKHARKLKEDLIKRDMPELIVLVQGLRNGLDFGLTAFEGFVRGAGVASVIVTKLYKAIAEFSNEITIAAAAVSVFLSAKIAKALTACLIRLTITTTILAAKVLLISGAIYGVATAVGKLAGLIPTTKEDFDGLADAAADSFMISGEEIENAFKNVPGISKEILDVIKRQFQEFVNAARLRMKDMLAQLSIEVKEGAKGLESASREGEAKIDKKERERFKKRLERETASLEKSTESRTAYMKMMLEKARKFEIDRATVTEFTEASIKAIREKAMKDMKFFASDYTEYLKREYDEQVEDFRTAGMTEVEIGRWLDEQKKEDRKGLLRHNLEQADNYFTAISAKLELERLESQSVYEKMAGFVSGAFDSMESTASDFFDDFMLGELDSFEDYARSFIDSIRKAWADLIADMMVRWLKMKLITGVLGAVSAGVGAGAGKGTLGTIFSEAELSSMLGHKGGIVGGDRFSSRWIPSSLIASAPRFHAGLLPNEFPAVLQKGEGVFTPAQMKALGGEQVTNVNIYAVDAMSFSELCRRNPEAILRPFREAVGHHDMSVISTIRTAGR